MAKKGFTVITVKDEIAIRLRQAYYQDKKLLMKRGITTFGGYLMYLLDEQEKRANRQ